MWHIRISAVLACRQFDLDTVHTVDTVDEENQYEYETYLTYISREGMALFRYKPSCHIVASLLLDSPI